MTLRQPITRIRRHQEHLLTITLKEVLGHDRKCLNQPGQTPGLCDTHRPLREPAGGAARDARIVRKRECSLRRMVALSRPPRRCGSFESSSHAGVVLYS